jgi:uncharacterized small protein (DUF1192 family)
VADLAQGPAAVQARSNRDDIAITSPSRTGGAPIMAEDQDDLPRRPTTKLPDLATWSVEELEAYIERLESEITRARAAIEARRSVRGAAEALFKKG